MRLHFVQIYQSFCSWVEHASQYKIAEGHVGGGRNHGIQKGPADSINLYKDNLSKKFSYLTTINCFCILNGFSGRSSFSIMINPTNQQATPFSPISPN